MLRRCFRGVWKAPRTENFENCRNTTASICLSAGSIVLNHTRGFAYALRLVGVSPPQLPTRFNHCWITAAGLLDNVLMEYLNIRHDISWLYMNQNVDSQIRPSTYIRGLMAIEADGDRWCRGTYLF